MNLKPSTTSVAINSEQAVLIPAALKTRSTPARNVPIVGGLCLSKGRLKDATCGYVEGFACTVPAQFEVLNRWNDGSVRWMLASFIAPEADSSGSDLGVFANADIEHPTTPPSNSATTVRLANQEICVVTRNLTSDPPTEQTLRLALCLRDQFGEVLPLEFDRVCSEVAGEVRQVFVVSAHIKTLPFVTLQLRLSHWTGCGLLQVETRIRNSRRVKHAGGLWDLGDAGSFLFGSLEIEVSSDDVPAAGMTHWKSERGQSVCTSAPEVFLRQLGSGGPNWNNSNHITASGQIGVSAQGYEISSDAGTLQGLRAEPTFMVQGDSSFLAVAVPEFWQQFPGSVAAAMGSLEIGLFPALPSVTYELQGGEQKTQSFWMSSGSGRGNIDHLDWVFDQPRLLQPATSISETNVLPWFHSSPTCLRSGPTQLPPGPMPSIAPTSRFETNRATSNKSADRFAQYLHDATSGTFSLDARRDSIDEYGWRNFGDVPANHEQTHYAGSNTIVSHYNNQFDMIFGGVLQLAATADLKWFDLLDPLARHVMDIDIYHTSNDRAAFNGGLFWHTDHYVDARSCTHRTYSRHNQKPGQPYGGGPSCEHNYTTGLLHYYFLTGNPEARESVLSLAEWVIRMDDGRNTIFGLFDSGSTGAASATVFEDFHGPGRGAGNSINALLDAWRLTSDDRYLSKLEELIRRCVHPEQNPTDLHLLDAEGHWSYTVFLNALGRYLIAKRDTEMFDAMYSYSRDVMKTYGRWMATHERRTLARPEELQYPTEAWAVQDFRKANVLRIAASCEDD
ncbi:MAG TPA: hypothetical protein PK992_13730, partial [Planctomycetaceae bacterium]|nr:hypothetical protein [Planctomycetaceae bacterium]